MTKSSQELPPAPAVPDSQWDSVDGQKFLEYNAESETYRASFDRDTRSVSTAVIATVAVVAEQHPQDLPPLYSAIEPDALEALVNTTATTPVRGDTHVSFLFHGHEITVHSYGIIAVEPLPNNGTTEQ